jgi:membrane associated rhomboid family serine protease
MRRKRERIFNVPPVVVWIIALLAAIEGLSQLLSPEAYLEFLRRFAFVPGRFTFAFAPDRVSLAFNSIADDGGLRQAAAYFLGDGRPQWWTPLTYAFLHGG